jgi:hypothetical protein
MRRGGRRAVSNTSGAQLGDAPIDPTFEAGKNTFNTGVLAMALDSQIPRGDHVVAAWWSLETNLGNLSHFTGIEVTPDPTNPRAVDVALRDDGTGTPDAGGRLLITVLYSS